MLSKNHPIIIFIDRVGFSVYQDTLTNIPRFNFTPDLVANLDVVNKEQFSNIIGTFIQINKIVPSSFAVILSDTIIYIKDLAKSHPNVGQEQKNEVQNFLENVPFEEVLAKVIKTEQKNTLCAVNKDLVMTIADVFVNKGSTIETVVPGFLFGQKVDFAIGLNQENIQVVLGRPEILKDGNLLIEQQKVTSPEIFAEQKEPVSEGKKPQNIRQFMLIGVFVTLLVILTVVYFNLGVSQTPLPAKKIKSSSAATISNPTANSTSVQNVVTVSPIDLRNVKIKIVQSSKIDAVADNLKNELLRIGFQDISEILGDSIPEKSSVVFSEIVPSDIRNIAIAEIKKILPDVSVLENQESNLMITILIGKS